jgi:NSS family neurotransmitter:Na+ symporter
MPILFILLIGLCIRSLTLPGAGQGLHFLFYPDWSKITGGVILAATGLAFFKLSIGMGCMMTYGSYFKADQNIPATALRVMIADLFVSLLAGVAVFPAVFSFGFEPQAGPSLLFMTIPAVFASLPFGSVFTTLFFILAAIAATGAMLSILEVPVAVISERWHISRRRATVLMLILTAILGAPAALSHSSMQNITLFQMNFFDLFDFISSNLFLPLSGMGVAIFVGWVWGYEKWEAAISNHGGLQNKTTAKIFFLLAKYTAPLAVILILLNGLGVF